MTLGIALLTILRFIGCQSPLIGRNRAYRVQIQRYCGKMWRFPKDRVLLILVLLTMPQLWKLFCAAAETRHRGGSLLMQANIFVGKERLCTFEMYECAR